jgi:hypothetical protein
LQAGAPAFEAREVAQEFDELGICLIPKAFPEEHLPSLRKALDDLLTKGPGSRVPRLPHLGIGAPDLHALFGELAFRLANRPARLVRILAFDKTPDTNWGVPWHQDRTIAVKKRADADGFGPWSMKSGMLHVEPPPWLLEGMFSLRLHLDDCCSENGPLKVLPGSHRLGRLPVKQVLELGSASPSMTCIAATGDILAMKALTVHASDPTASPAHRRVLHLDFTTIDLPPPLEWAMDG